MEQQANAIGRFFSVISSLYLCSLTRISETNIQTVFIKVIATLDSHIMNGYEREQTPMGAYHTYQIAT